ncbi:hypothetical protein ACWCPQ_34320 [Nocardia sp. NPDC001965]
MTFADVPITGIAFSDGITDGLDSPDDPEFESAPGEMAGAQADTPPGREHHSILDTPQAPPSTGSKKPSPLCKQLTEMYVMAGTGLFMVDPQIGSVVIGQAETCAASLDALAKKDPRVKRALESMLATGAWSGVIAAHLPIVVAVGTKYVPELKRRYMDQTGSAAA